MREAFDRRGKTMHQLLNGIDGVTVPRARRAPSTPSRSFKAILGAAIAAASASTPPSSWPSILLDEAKVAIVPGEAFGAPGYARLSFALGDDDLGEGVSRIADLLAADAGGRRPPPAPVRVVAVADHRRRARQGRGRRGRGPGRRRDVWWTEARPAEGGRTQLVRRTAAGTRHDLFGPPADGRAWNARTQVHEYGGGAWAVRDGDRRVRRLGRPAPPPGRGRGDADGEPQPLTPEPSVPRGLRYAEPVWLGRRTGSSASASPTSPTTWPSTARPSTRSSPCPPTAAPPTTRAGSWCW